MQEQRTEESAVITAPGMESFRECVVFAQNGIRLLDKDNQLIKTAADDGGEVVDAEDTVPLRPAIICTAPEALNGMSNPVCGVSSEC